MLQWAKELPLTSQCLQSSKNGAMLIKARKEGKPQLQCRSRYSSMKDANQTEKKRQKHGISASRPLILF